MGTYSAQSNNIMEKDRLLDLMRSKNTIFTFKDVSLLWGESDANFMKKKIHRYVKSGKLYAVRRGIYAKDKNYDKFELATKIFTPSYVSFETVLAKAGVTFQLYEKIFVATYQSKEITCDNQVYSFKTIKKSILINDAGIEKKESYSMATPERAFLDVVYLYKDYHFDNLSGVHWGKVFEILPIYGGNTRMAKKVKEYHEATKHT